MEDPSVRWFSHLTFFLSEISLLAMFADTGKELQQPHKHNSLVAIGRIPQNQLVLIGQSKSSWWNVRVHLMAEPFEFCQQLESARKERIRQGIARIKHRVGSADSN